LRRIQAQIAGERLVLNQPEGDRLVRYYERYGSGGFQGRLRRIVDRVREQLSPAD
jgi:hypothetical protein